MDFGKVGQSRWHYAIVTLHHQRDEGDMLKRSRSPCGEAALQNATRKQGTLLASASDLLLTLSRVIGHQKPFLKTNSQACIQIPRKAGTNRNGKQSTLESQLSAMLSARAHRKGSRLSWGRSSLGIKDIVTLESYHLGSI